MNIDNDYTEPPADKLLGGTYDPQLMFPLTPSPPPPPQNLTLNEMSGGVQRPQQGRKRRV